MPESSEERGTPVPRPHKNSDYRILTMGPGVEKGWRDCVAAARSAMSDAWDQLTEAPTEQAPRQYQLRGDDAYANYQGARLPQWEYKITNGGRLIYLVDDSPVLDAAGRKRFAGTVYIVEASAKHPKWTETVKGSRKGPGRR